LRQREPAGDGRAQQLRRFQGFALGRWVLRYRLSIDRQLLSRILDGFLRTVFSWQRRRGRKLGIAGGHTGAVTFVQRFGSALNLHPHLHSLVPDGLFVPGPDKEFEFVPLPPPTRDDIEALLRKIAQRLTRLVQSVADEEASFGARWEQTAAAMEEALARSLRAPAPADQLTFAEQDHEERTGGPDALRAKLAGFSLHAGRWVPSEDREALERLCR
jgi:hypothetical protein